MSERPPEDREEWIRQVRERLAREDAQKRNRPSRNGAKNRAADNDPQLAARDQMLRELRSEIDQLNCGAEAEHVAAIVERVAAWAPDEITRELLLRTIKAQTKTSMGDAKAHRQRR